VCWLLAVAAAVYGGVLCCRAARGGRRRLSTGGGVSCFQPRGEFYSSSLSLVTRVQARVEGPSRSFSSGCGMWLHSWLLGCCSGADTATMSARQSFSQSADQSRWVLEKGN
jgi:hypothetical protein